MPPEPARLIGRDRELTKLGRLLVQRGPQLVTLTGPSGAGKTRLALQVAGDLAGSFPGGVYYAPLECASNSDDLASALAAAVALPYDRGDRRPLFERLEGLLGNGAALILLDDVDQGLAPYPLLTRLLAACPALKALVTSRDALHLPGEQEFPVPPLALPTMTCTPELEAVAGCAAVDLFIERASAVQPDFVLTDENVQAVAGICARLGGLPLAIELAAALSTALTPGALLALLDRALPPLPVRPPDLAAQEETMHKTVASSYHLLDDDEQRLFRWLTVFAGGCSLGAAESVCTALGATPFMVLDSLDVLVERNLVWRQETAGNEVRISFPQPVRDYGWGQLAKRGELESAGQRHAEYYLGLAFVAERRQGRTGEWTQLDKEQANLQAALRWCARAPGAGPDLQKHALRHATNMARRAEDRHDYAAAEHLFDLALTLQQRVAPGTPSPAAIGN